MQAMRATFNKLRDLAGKWLVPTRPLALQPQPDSTRAQTSTNLKARLTSLTLTQSQFAQLCEVHPNTVGNWACGRTRMNHAAELVLQVLEADHRAAQYVAGQRTRGRPRGKPFEQGKSVLVRRSSPQALCGRSTDRSGCCRVIRESTDGSRA
jgi:DNA-binding transcriptional regulator YiaG